jgi:hypothetical protein
MPSNAIAVELPQRMIANKRETVGFFKLYIFFNYAMLVSISRMSASGREQTFRLVPEKSGV